jgi:2-methylisocitrate lyase-like PEP mutase family enzyme
MRSMTDSPEPTELLRSLHVPGNPLVLPNVWDAATARSVQSAGFPVVATTSGGVAESLGYADHEGAPADEMLAAARRIIQGVDVPVTVDAEAGYGMSPADLVAALHGIGAAGCNLEDTDHAAGKLRDKTEHAQWLHDVRQAAQGRGYGVVINARIDVILANRDKEPPIPNIDLVDEALDRAQAYVDAGADCVYPIGLAERDAITAFVERSCAPVNLMAFPLAPPIPDLAELGAARISLAGGLYRRAMQRFDAEVAELKDQVNGLAAKVGQVPQGPSL